MTDEQIEACEKLRAKYADRFVLNEAVDGHYWGRFKNDGEYSDWELCLHCAVIRRADKKNKPCRGPHKITLR